MRSTILALLIGCGLAAAIAPAFACPFKDSAQNNQQQTAQAQPPAESGAN